MIQPIRKFLALRFPSWVSVIILVAMAHMFLFRPDWSNANVRFQMAVIIVGTLAAILVVTNVVRRVRRKKRGS